MSFLSFSGVPGHILVSDEFNHVQPNYLLLPKPKVRGSIHNQKVPQSQNSKQKNNNKQFSPLHAGFALVSVMRSPGVPSSKCRRRTRWSCSTRTPSESPWHAATAMTARTPTPPSKQTTRRSTRRWLKAWSWARRRKGRQKHTAGKTHMLWTGRTMQNPQLPNSCSTATDCWNKSKWGGQRGIVCSSNRADDKKTIKTTEDE